MFLTLTPHCNIMTPLWLPSPSALLSAHSTQQARMPPVHTMPESTLTGRPNLPPPSKLASQPFVTDGPELRPLLPLPHHSDLTPSATSTLTSLSASATASPSRGTFLHPTVAVGSPSDSQLDRKVEQKQSMSHSAQALLAACTVLQTPLARPTSVSTTCSPTSVVPTSHSHLSPLPSPTCTPKASTTRRPVARTLSPTPSRDVRLGTSLGKHVERDNRVQTGVRSENLRDQIIATTMTTTTTGKACSDISMSTTQGHSSKGGAGVTTIIKKVFHCPVAGCTQTSSNRGNLSKHIATRHEHRKDFACPFEGCTRRFAKKYNMLRHLSASGVHRSSPQTAILSSPPPKSLTLPTERLVAIEASPRGPPVEVALVPAPVLKKVRRGGQSRSRWSSLELDLARFLVDQYRKSIPASH